MRKGFLCSLFSLIAFVGIAKAQYPGYYPPAGPGYGAPYSSSGPRKVYVGGALSRSGSIALPSVRKVSYQLAPRPAVKQTVQPTKTKAVAGQPNTHSPIRQINSHDPQEKTSEKKLPEAPVKEETVQSYYPPQVVVTEVVEAPIQEDIIPAGEVYYPAYHIPSHSGRMPMRAPRGYRWYGNAEFLFWWIEGQEAPPLLVDNTGMGASPLVGGELDFDNSERTGAKLTVGKWLDSWNDIGLEGTYFFLGQRSPQYATIQTGNNLAIPFVNADTGAPALFDLGQDGSTSQFDLFSRIYGGEATVRYQWCRGCWGHFDLLAGFRYWHMDEGLSITTQANMGGGNIATIRDVFGTDNSFYGGQIGLSGEVHLTKRIFLGLTGKVALGSTSQTVDIAGNSTLVTPMGTTNFDGGIFAQPSNSGSYRQNAFTVMPEVNIRLGARVTDNIRVAGGYTFLWISNIVRVGEQIDPTLSPAQILGNVGTGPRALLTDTGFWMHGITGELEFRF